MPEGNGVVLRSPLQYFREHFVGLPMKGAWQPPEIDARGGGCKAIPDFLSWMLSAPVVSSKARQALEPLIAPHAEFLPLPQVRGSDLWAANVITLVDCLDEGRSRILYSRDEPCRIVNVATFAFKDDCVPDIPIFKLASYPVDVFVTRSFVEQVRTAGLTGAAFADPAVNPLPLILKGQSLNVIRGAWPAPVDADEDP